MKIEWWKYIPGYEGLYMASNLGRIKSFYKSQEGIILKPHLGKRGYFVVDLRFNGKRKMCYVHRLVALTWLENPDNLPCVDHIDTNRENNCVSNLRWVTHKENHNNPLSIINISEAHKGYKPSQSSIDKKSKKVNQYTLEGTLVRVWPSVIEITRQTGWSQGTISNCCLGKQKTAYGFKWSYLNDSPTIYQF